MDGLEDKVRGLVRWMRQKSHEAHAKGGVVGVSGGVDSALALALAKEAWPENCLGLVMPCHSIPEDAEEAVALAGLLKCPHRVVDLTQTYDVLLQGLRSGGYEPDALSAANLKPRLRMVTLYYYANLLNYIVVGTGNRDEIYVGYFTKYGDGGVDILPLATLTKGEVREMARYMGVPDRIVDKPPSAGLWKGQTDEDEMGIFYRDIDAYLLGQEVSPSVKEKIESRHRATQHKRATPPVPDLD